MAARRISYTIPPATGALPTLSFPPLDTPRRAHAGPLYSDALPPRPASTANAQGHRLAVQSLAIDLETSISPANEPAGILYSGGRDGVVCSWELGLKTRRRSNSTSNNERNPTNYGANYGDRDSDDDGSEIYDNFEPLEQSGRVLETRARNGSTSRGSTSRLSNAIGTSTTTAPPPPVGRWEIDDARLKRTAPKGKFRQCVQNHTDAVNDLVLADHNRSLVSCSDDGSLMVWRPHGTPAEQVSPSILGRHSDYCRTLAVANDVVVSGGFDQKVKLWDLGEGRKSPMHEFTNSTTTSIYSLSTTQSGSLIAVGSTDPIIRCWDPRTPDRQVCQLSGHSDVVRALQLSGDGKWLLSASSDTTVKIFSLVAQKNLFSFSMHGSSVWSLFSDHPNLERFYSGSRDGLLVKVDFEGTGNPGDGECVVLARDDGESDGAVSGREGISSIVAKEDTYVWTAAGRNSIKRWKDIPPKSRRAGPVVPRTVDNETMSIGFSSESTDQLLPPSSLVYPPSIESNERDRSGLPSVSFLEGLTTTLSRTTSTPTASPHEPIPATIRRPSSLRSTPRPLYRVVEPVLTSISTDPSLYYDIPWDAQVPLTSIEDSYFPTVRHRDADTATIYSTTGSFGRRPGSIFAHTPTASSHLVPNGLDIDAATQAGNIARREYLERADALETTPLRSSPDDIIGGASGGIVRCALLNDRRHLLSIDAQQEVFLWDLVEGKAIGVFSQEEMMKNVPRRPSDGSIDSIDNVGYGNVSRDLLEMVKERIEGEGSTSTWCTCTSRIGSLSVHLDEAQVFDAEVYADESHLAQQTTFPSDHRLNLGKWVLRSLFDGFINAEQLPPSPLTKVPGKTTPTLRRSTEAPHFSLSDLASPSIQSSADRTPGMTLALATPALTQALPPDLSDATTAPRADLALLTPVPHSPLGTPHTRQHTSSGLATEGEAKSDYFSLPATPATSDGKGGTPKGDDAVPVEAPTLPTPGGGLMGRFKFGKGTKKAAKVEEEAVVIAEPVDETPEEQAQRIRARHLSPPHAPYTSEDAPPLFYDPNIAITISEKTNDATGFAVIYRGLVGTAGMDRKILEEELPLYSLAFLLKGEANLKEPIKVSFVLYPWGSAEQARLPDLPNVNTRLTASRGLRVRKIHGYIADKLELRSPRSRAASISSVSRLAQAQQPSPMQSFHNPAMQASTPITSPSLASSQSLAQIPPTLGGNGFGGIAMDDERDFDPETAIEILCGDEVLPPHMSLASIRSFCWKGGSDIILNYRLRA